MPKTLNIGMVGYKFMGRAHSNAWMKAAKFFDLKAKPVMKVVCGRDKSAVAGMASRWGWERFETNWREVINDPMIDIVDINAPNNVHAEIAIAAAKAGKAIFCEKPLGMNVKECKDMVAAVKKAGVTNMICHTYRRIPAIAQMKKMIDAGDLGQIYHFRARYAQDWIVDPKFPLVWRLQSKIAGYGTHGDINAHIIDFARHLVGEFKEISALMETFIKERPIMASQDGLSAKASEKMGKVDVDDAVLMIGRFQNGALFNIEATRFALGRKNGIQLEVNGSKGSLVFDFEDMNRLQYFNNADPADRKGFRSIIVTEGGGVHPYVGAWWPPGHIIGYEHTFIHAAADFINAVADRKPVKPDFEDGLVNHMVLEAVEESAKTRKWVKL